MDTIVHADNVMNYVMKHGLEHGWDDLCSFVCSRCPFPSAQIEFEVPDKLRLPGHEDLCRAFIRVEELPAPIEFEGNSIGPGYSKLLDATYTGGGKRDEVVSPGEAVERLKAFQEDIQPASYLRVDILKPGEGLRVGTTNMFGMDSFGKILKDKNGVAYLRFAPPRDQHLVHQYRHIVDFLMIVGLATLNFMNCKNVELVDNRPLGKWVKKAIKRGELPPVAYKTLVLHPFGKRNRALQRSEAGVIGDTALHIVRGHFKDYRGGEGLGRSHVRGLWWWGPQVRGTNPDRVVEKDYSVQTH